MAAERFVEALNAQIGNELAAHNQYLACAVHYDAETMPQMAAFFYAQALEERDHALMMVQYLLDTDAEVTIPGVGAPIAAFADVVAPGGARPGRRRSGSPSRSTACCGSPARRTTSPPSSSCSGSSRSRSRRSRP